VAALAYSPDGKTLAVALPMSGFVLCDARTGRELTRIGLDEFDASGRPCVAYSPDGKALALAYGTLCFLDLASGKERLRTPVSGRAAREVAFSPDGKLLATHDLEALGVLLRDPNTGKQVRRLEGVGVDVGQLTFCPAGKLLAAAGPGAVNVWEVATGAKLYHLSGPTEAITRIGFAPDGKVLATATAAEPAIRFWDAQTGRLLRTWDAPKGIPQHPRFSPDGKLLASVGGHGLILLRDAETGKEVRQLRGHVQGVTALTFSPDGKTLAAASNVAGAVFRWDTATGERIGTRHGHENWVLSLAFSRDGRSLLSYGMDGRLLSWDLATGQETSPFLAPVEDARWQVGTMPPAVSPDLRKLFWVRDGAAFARDLREGTAARRLLPAGDLGTTVAYSPDGKWGASLKRIATGLIIQVNDPSTGEVLRPMQGFVEDVRGLTFSPDGKRLAGASPQGTVRVWDVATGEQLQRRQAVLEDYPLLTFAADGRTLVGRVGGRIQLWDTASLNEVAPAVQHDVSNALAISADGRYLATGGGVYDNAIHVWETVTGQRVRTLRGHHSGVRCLAFSPDGRVLASGAGDTTTLVWDLTNGIRSAVRLDATEVAALWEALAGTAPEANRAAWRLAAAPNQAIRLLKKRLAPVPEPAPGRLARLLADLESDGYDVRQKATQELEELGELAVPAVSTALKSKPSLEARRRLERLLAKCEPGSVPAGERLRAMRAMLVLEQIGTVEARELLRTLGRGAPASRLTREARASLDRLAK
jgi:WD40 repeat protein